MSKIVRWNTPFTDSPYPAVEFLTTIEKDKYNVLKVLVAPLGIDEYPKYLLDFGQVIAFTCMEEAHAPERNFDSASITETNLSAYQWIDSPWLKSYEPQIHFISSGHLGYFSHYLIFGGDNNVEVITPYKPSIELIEQKRLFKVERDL